MQLKIKKQKGDICPICKQEIKHRNYWVKYHIRYLPTPLVILACRYCNYVEYILRLGISISKIRCATPNRIMRVLNFQLKYGIKI